MEGPARELQTIIGAKLVSAVSADGWMTLHFVLDDKTWMWAIRLGAALPLEEVHHGT
jgi:hypothetical protein